MLTSINHQLGISTQTPMRRAVKDVVLIAVDIYLDSCIEQSDVITPGVIFEGEQKRVQSTLLNMGITFKRAFHANFCKK